MFRVFLILMVAFTFIGCKENQKIVSIDQRPNIIFIMTDDHTINAISSYGSQLNETQNIDRLAKNGMLFRNAFVTNSICGPSRAVILTGKHSHLNGVRDNHTRFDSTQITFPKILQKNGYETAIVGKWHLQSEPSGFDYWNVLPGQGDYYNPDFIKMGKDTVYEGYVTDITTDLAIEWMSKRKNEKPFMLMVHQKAPHRNWMPNLKNLDVYEESEFEVPDTFFDNYAGREHLKDQQLTVAKHMDISLDLKVPCDTCSRAEVNNWALGKYKKDLARFTDAQRAVWEEGYESEIAEFFGSNFSPEERARWNLKRYLQDYLRTILSVDESVGALLDYVEKNGMAENTLIVYTSDQGFFLGEHGLFDKRYMYEESLRTPLLMQYLGKIKPGSTSDELVQNLDFSSTFLDVAGVPAPEAFQGQSLVPLFESTENPDWRKSIYYHFYEDGWGVPQHHGVRTKDYKLIHFTSGTESWEFYDLEADPKEMKNLYNDVSYKQQVGQLKKELKKLQTEYKVQ